MKLKTWIPCLAIAIAASSFTTTTPSTNTKTKVNYSSSLPYCAIYAIESFTRNGAETGADLSKYRIYFCDDYTLSVWSPTDVTQGSWYIEKDMMVINVPVGDDMNWLNGTWTLLSEFDYILEMERTDTDGSTLRVRFERRQR